MQAVFKDNLRSRIELTSNSDDAGENNVYSELHHIPFDWDTKRN